MERKHHGRREVTNGIWIPGTGRCFLSVYQTGEFRLLCIKGLFLRLQLTNQVRPDRFVLKKASDCFGLSYGPLYKIVFHLQYAIEREITIIIDLGESADFAKYCFHLVIHVRTCFILSNEWKRTTIEMNNSQVTLFTFEFRPSVVKSNAVVRLVCLCSVDGVA